MTGWWWIGLASSVLLAVALEIRRRRREYWTRADYVQHIREWYERDAYGDEPTIRQADLPPVKSLKARPMERVDRVSRFTRRVGEGR